MGDYRSLRVWKQAHQLTLQVYRLTALFPPSERYGLTSQIRRAAASIAANIAEGCGRNSDAELARFCRIALGSANELDYHLLLARDLDLIPAADYGRAYAETEQVRRMLSALIERLFPSIADSR